MIKLKPLSSVDKEKHFTLLAARFNKQYASFVANGDTAPHDRSLINHLKNSLRLVLLGTPAEIESFSDNIIKRFPDFSAYAISRRKSTHPNQDIHKNTLAAINSGFDYTWFSNQKSDWGPYALIQAYRLRICPYCQTNHLNLHVKKSNRERGGTTFQLRPPLDHYLPKSAYPYLAVSLSNLVPSCAPCNSGIKANSDPRGKGLPHPLDTTKVSIRFSSKGTLRRKLNGPLQADDVILSLTGLDNPSASHIREFRLQERYDWYRHEVKDLLIRNEQHRDLNRKLRSVTNREFYVLGFLEADAEMRHLGLCLRDIYREIAP